ncbi:MAG: 4-hydroxy-3-methylbut-2-enyl diphosphate reductase [Desulfobacteraceae bacterium]
MKITVAKTAGFCMGVRRAVELALDAPGQYPKPIYTYGPLIHNPQVLALFEEKGVTILKEIPQKGSGTVLVRAHGIPPGTRERLKEAGFKVINATCPRVVKVQSIIKSHARKGFAVIIVGDEDHPEVVGLLGYAGEKGLVLPSLDALKVAPEFDQAIIVAQTTQNLREYNQIKKWAERHRSHYKIYHTICDSTEKRQAEVRRIASEADAVVVVGGKKSGNTQRLAKIVQAVGKKAYHLETEDELDMDALAGMQHVAITAGASTPSWIIKRVLRAVQQLPMRRGKGLLSLWMSVERFVLLTNLYVALGAGAVAYAATHLQGLPTVYPAIAAAFFYVISMHILNHLTGRAESRYNDPEREQFYNRYKAPLTSMALVAGALGLVAAYQIGVLAFWSLFFMSVLGLTYNLRMLPYLVGGHIKFRSLRSFPGSKTFLIALAWGVVTAVLPALAVENGRLLTGAVVFLWAAGLVFCRTAFFDILDMQGDRIVGKETLPILIGQQRAFNLLKYSLASGVLILLAAGLTGVITPLGYPLILPSLLLRWVVHAHEKGSMLPGMQMELKVESLLVLSGIIAFLYCFIFRLCAG